MLQVKQLSQFYGSTQILWHLGFRIAPGSCTCIMGRNGAGKTTLLKCLMGLLPIKKGEIYYDGLPLHSMSAELRATHGIAYVPQGRDIFPHLTVEENLRIGLTIKRKSTLRNTKLSHIFRTKKLPDRIFTLFPALKCMLQRQGGNLSGGQQQQLAIARALVLSSKLLILDEPNEGIQPNIVKHIGQVIKQLNHEDGLTVLLVEQKLGFARSLGHHFHLLEKGRIVASNTMDKLTDELIEKHLAI